MYVSVSRLRIDPGLAGELVTAFRRRARLVESHEGFIDLQVWQADGDDGEILMVSRWQSRESFKRYMKSADHATSHHRITPALKDGIQLERLEHLSGYDVVAE